MGRRDGNIILCKAMDFAVRIVKLYNFLISEKKSMYYLNNYSGAAHLSGRISMKHKKVYLKKNLRQKSILPLRKHGKQNIGLNYYSEQTILIKTNSIA